MGRPSKLTPHARTKFIQAAQAGAPLETAAQFAEFSPASLWRYMQGRTPEHASFRDEVIQTVAALEVRLAGTLTRAAMNDPKWALAWLERRASKDWRLRAAAELAATESRPEPRRKADEPVVLDQALIDELVPRLLAVGDERRGGRQAEPVDLSRFRDRARRRPAADEESPR